MLIVQFHIHYSTIFMLSACARCWAAVDVYGMAEEVGIVGAEELQEPTSTQAKEGRTEKWTEEEETKTDKSNKDIKVGVAGGGDQDRQVQQGHQGRGSRRR